MMPHAGRPGDVDGGRIRLDSTQAFGGWDERFHCRTESEAQDVRRAVERRLLQCKLETHPKKTHIVYCRDSNRTEEHSHIQFDFLGYGYKPRRARNSRDGRYFVSFAPAIGRKAMKATVRDWGHPRGQREGT